MFFVCIFNSEAHRHFGHCIFHADDSGDGRSVLSVRQAKAREAREQRRAQLTGAHHYMIGMVAEYLDLEQNSVEDFVIDDFKVTQFFAVVFLCEHL